MQPAVRQHHYVTASVLAAAGLVAVAPIAPRLPAVQVAKPEASNLAVRLTDDASFLNIPLNFFQDLVNIPANEINALEVLAQSLFYSGPWWVGSPTNIWGEDPGDPGHFEAITQMLFPFPELSGAGHEGDLFYPGLGQQAALWATVQIPADPTCASLDCFPVMPTSPITGLTWLDQPIWSFLIATGLQKFPLINNWFQVSPSEMSTDNPYYFDPNSPSMHSPGVANDGFLWEGTKTLQELGLNPADYPNIDPDQPLMPWAGQSYAMDFKTPFDNFYNSLLQPFDWNNFQLPSLEEFGRSIQALIASMVVAFNPFIPGSPLCPGDCLWPGVNPWGDTDTDGVPSYYAMVKFIGDLWPGNSIINEWLSDYDDGTANISPPEFIETESELWRLGQTVFDFGNGMPTDPRMLPLAIDTSDWLPSESEIHAALGDYWFNILDNSGFLGPFDFQGLWDAIFDVPPTAAVDVDPTPVLDALSAAL